MIFQNPFYFILFIPLTLLAVYRLGFRRQQRPALQYSGIGSLKKVPRGFRSYLKFLPPTLLFLAMSFFIVALARPRSADTKVRRDVEGIDIMFLFDISDSMLIEDMQPVNRVESAKKTISDFVKMRTSDRMGLIVFAGESYTRVPLTMDYPILLDSLSKVETGHEGKDLKMGTAIGVALANGVARLKDSTAKSRVIILLTDGENNSGTIDPITALDIAKGYGIRIYTIGIGVDGEAQLPIYQTDVFGNTYKRYQPIHSTVNDELLQRLADETGGKYYRAIKTDALQNAYKEINTLEKSKIEVNQFVKYTENFQTFLFYGLICFSLAQLMNYTILRRVP